MNQAKGSADNEPHQPHPKALILDLLSANGDQALHVHQLIRAAALFGITENSVRVTTARLCAAGLIQVAARGTYQLGDAASNLAGDVAGWRTLQSRLRPWPGGYLMVYCGALGRSDRATVRRRERALQMLGFRALDRGLHLRPANIEANMDAVRQRLYRIGLDPDAVIFLAQQLEPRHERRVHQLWDGAALSRSYRQHRLSLDGWLAGSPQWSLPVAAREAFLLGGNAIRQLVFDPLLPAPWVDIQERDAFFQCVQRFDAAGRAIWRRFFDMTSTPS